MNANPATASFYSKIGVSLLSSMVMSLVVYPFDTAKRCMQLNGARGHFSTYKSSLDCMTTMVKKNGLPSMYRGVHLFAIKELLTAVAQVNAYDLIVKN